jgi:hypothetical protein
MLNITRLFALVVVCTTIALSLRPPVEALPDDGTTTLLNNNSISNNDESGDDNNGVVQAQQEQSTDFQLPPLFQAVLDGFSDDPCNQLNQSVLARDDILQQVTLSCDPSRVQRTSRDKYNDGKESMCGECLCELTSALWAAGVDVTDTASLSTCGPKAESVLRQAKLSRDDVVCACAVCMYSLLR